MKRKSDTIDTEVLVVGGGLSGLTLAAVLGRAGVPVTVIDRDDPARQRTAAYDGRTTAISFGSRRVLQAAGVWDALEQDAGPIRDIRVADGDAPLWLRFDAGEGDEGAFGWILDNHLIRRRLAEAVGALGGVTWRAPAEATGFFSDSNSAGAVLKGGERILARLMVGADGRASAVRDFCGIGVRRRDYGQTAIVCNVTHEQPHGGIALEHFLPDGPFAVLPMTDDDKGRPRSSVVWTVETAAAGGILALSAPEFDAALQKMFARSAVGRGFGRVAQLTPPRAFPLALVHAKRYTAPRVALVADAAHAIHPIAGQGLNLGMRDIAALAELVIARHRLGLDIGGASLLDDYAARRRADTLLMVGFTDGLNRLFSNDHALVSIARKTGLAAVEKMPFLKRFFARQAMGLGGLSGSGSGGIIDKGHV